MPKTLTEPFSVNAQITIKNITSSSVRCAKPHGKVFFHVEYEAMDKKFRPATKATCFEMYKWVSSREVIIEQGESIKLEQDVCRQFDLTLPGTYNIYAYYFLNNGVKICSKTSSLSVAEPPDIGKVAVNQLTKNGNYDAILKDNKVDYKLTISTEKKNLLVSESPKILIFLSNLGSQQMLFHGGSTIGVFKIEVAPSYSQIGQPISSFPFMRKTQFAEYYFSHSKVEDLRLEPNQSATLTLPVAWFYEMINAQSYYFRISALVGENKNTIYTNVLEIKMCNTVESVKRADVKDAEERVLKE